MNALRSWWVQFTVSERVLIGVAAATAIVAIVGFVMASNRAAGESIALAQRDAADDHVAELESDIAAVEVELADATAQLTAAESRVTELDQQASEQAEELAGAASAGATLEAELAEASDSLRGAQSALVEARTDLRQAEELVAELTLAYSQEIDAARATLSTAALGFACDWGTSLAADGRNASAATGTGALTAFNSSDDLATLRAVPEIVTAIEIALTLDERPYGVGKDELESAAIACWQTEDKKLNAALYQYHDIYVEAALDAACTIGASDVYDDWGGYRDTAVYQNWSLTVGGDAVRAYEEAVEGRFGSVRAFVAISDEELQAEEARCEEIQPLIAPKSGGTWNVGDEIKPGTWKAYDESDCYWARLSENGDIRANHFGDALRLTVNVQSGDGQFEISHCTFFYANP